MSSSEEENSRSGSERESGSENQSQSGSESGSGSADPSESGSRSRSQSGSGSGSEEEQSGSGGSGSGSGSDSKSGSSSESGEKDEEDDDDDDNSQSGSASRSSRSMSSSGSDKKVKADKKQKKASNSDTKNKNKQKGKMPSNIISESMRDVVTPMAFGEQKSVSFRRDEPSISSVLSDIENLSTQISSLIQSFPSQQHNSKINGSSSPGKYNQEYGVYRSQQPNNDANSNNMQNNLRQSIAFTGNFSEIQQQQQPNSPKLDLYKEAYRSAYHDAYCDILQEKERSESPKARPLEEIVESQKLDREQLHKQKMMDGRIQNSQETDQQDNEDEQEQKEPQREGRSNNPRSSINEENIKQMDNRMKRNEQSKINSSGSNGYQVSRDAQNIIDNYYRNLYKPKQQQRFTSQGGNSFFNNTLKQSRNQSTIQNGRSKSEIQQDRFLRVGQSYTSGFNL